MLIFLKYGIKNNRPDFIEKGRKEIYNRFRDIDEINLIVAGRCNDELLRNAQNAMKEEAGYYENLIALVQAEFTYIYERNAFFPVLYSAVSGGRDWNTQ